MLGHEVGVLAASDGTRHPPSNGSGDLLREARAAREGGPSSAAAQILREQQFSPASDAAR